MKILTANIFWVYLGLLLGVSFIATPIKFKAPSLMLPVALDVGRVTFHYFHKIEWCFVLMALFGAIWTKQPLVIGLSILLVVILLVDGLYFLPKLDQRIDLIMQGEVLTKSWLHKGYVVLEISKVVLCIVSGVYMQGRM
ncbi:MAG: hypothetical protein KDD46_05450 [Bdellovibrionales bacterium]|nr:hypothetical protein [Bdellovibrionales bacterium]